MAQGIGAVVFEMMQYFTNGIISAAYIALVGVGVLLVYRASSYLPFTHGAIFAFSAYMTYFLAGILQVPVFLAVAFGGLAAASLGVLLETLGFGPLRERGGGALVLLIAAIGLYTVLVNILSLAFGDTARTLRFWTVEEGWRFFSARITTVQIITLTSSLICLLGTWAFIRRTRLGRCLKAVANDSELALIVGIEVGRIHLWAAGVGSALVGIAGILFAYDVDMTPSMGLRPLMTGVVAMLIGGGTLWGTMFGALLIGIVQQLGVIWVSARWQEAIVFVILLAFLIFRPQGFFGKRVKKATV